MCVCVLGGAVRFAFLCLFVCGSACTCLPAAFLSCFDSRDCERPRQCAAAWHGRGVRAEEACVLQGCFSKDTSHLLLLITLFICAADSCSVVCSVLHCSHITLRVTFTMTHACFFLSVSVKPKTTPSHPSPLRCPVLPFTPKALPLCHNLILPHK